MIEEGRRGLTRRLTPVRDGPTKGGVVGGWGELQVTGRERHAGGKAIWGWAAEGAATIYKETPCGVTVFYKR